MIIECFCIDFLRESLTVCLLLQFLCVFDEKLKKEVRLRVALACLFIIMMTAVTLTFQFLFCISFLTVVVKNVLFRCQEESMTNKLSDHSALTIQTVFLDTPSLTGLLLKFFE